MKPFGGKPPPPDCPPEVYLLDFLKCISSQVLARIYPDGRIPTAVANPAATNGSTQHNGSDEATSAAHV